MVRVQGEKRYSTSWFSPGMGSSVRCPVEGCTHTSVNLITKAHLRIAHGMTKDEVIESYGHPEVMSMKGFISSDKSSKLYYSVANNSPL